MYIKKFKSTKKIPRYDEYNRLIGEFTVRMIVNSILVTGDEITPSGFYYYFNDSGETVTIAPIKNTSFNSEIVGQVESTLDAFSSSSIFEAVAQRTHEFAYLRWEQENGSSFGLMANEWEIDLD